MFQESPLPTPRSSALKSPLERKDAAQLLHFRNMAIELLCGKDKRLILIVGPCSIHDPTLALEYALRLKKLSEKVDQEIVLIMRAFLEKPRTQHGWKGFLYDPDLDGSCNIEKGIQLSRELLLQLLKMKVPVATEFLDPSLMPYTQDLITWGVIGARTSSSQIHRLMASHLSFPVGLKNATNGSLDEAICGAIAARSPQVRVGINSEGTLSSIKTPGNPYTHLILRGSHQGPNASPEAVRGAFNHQKEHGLLTPLLIDCAHGNSQKNLEKQIEIFKETIKQYALGTLSMKGVMVESHLEEGNALSLTDPCLDWETTKELILWANSLLSESTKAICST